MNSFSNLKVAIEIFRSFIENVHIKSLETMRQVCFTILLLSIEFE